MSELPELKGPNLEEQFSGDRPKVLTDFGKIAVLAIGVSATIIVTSAVDDIQSTERAGGKGQPVDGTLVKSCANLNEQLASAVPVDLRADWPFTNDPTSVTKHCLAKRIDAPHGLTCQADTGTETWSCALNEDPAQYVWIPVLNAVMSDFFHQAEIERGNIKIEQN